MDGFVILGVLMCVQFARSGESSFNVTLYKEKICENQPTCDLISNIPDNVLFKEDTTLRVRNCMCDADCSKYGDCCLDSKFYRKSEQKENFQNYHCSYLEQVYMKTKCPPDYDNDDVKNKCEKSILPLDSDDKKLIIPVTNLKTSITYGNVYCAQCHGEDDYEPWNLTSYCSVVLTQFVERDDFKQNYPLADLDEMASTKTPSYRVDDFADLTENSTYPTTLNDLLNESEEATKYIKFDSKTKSFYSVYKEKNFTCSYGRIMPKELELYTRPCVTVISECANSTDDADEKCRSYTAFVFDGFVTYRNRDCATCNGVNGTLSGCSFNMAVPGVTFSHGSSIFNTADKGHGANPCSVPALKEKFCK